MKKQLFNKVIFFLFLSFSFLNLFTQFFYPVAAIEDSEKKQHLFFIYQKNLDTIEFFSYNIETMNFKKELSSALFTPAGIQVLPSKKGFSFIDNGKVRVKYFNKRLPKTIDIFESIYNIELIKWIDDKTFYTFAKKDRYYGIFQIDIEGKVKEIIYQKGFDCLYPQKIGNKLFYIERSKRFGEERVISVSYLTNYHTIINSDFNDILTFKDKVTHLMKDDQLHLTSFDKTVICHCGTQLTLFLNMISEHKGFFLQHSKSLNKKVFSHLSISFSFFQIEKKIDRWEKTFLFSFSIPSDLILEKSSKRLYESILPFIPYYFNDKIYYTDSMNDEINLFSFSLTDKKIVQKTFCTKKQMFFAPINSGESIFYGSNNKKFSFNYL